MDQALGAVAPLTAVIAVTGAGCPGAGDVPTATSLDDATRATECLLDAERARHGLRAVHSIASLALAARRHSRSMARHHYFGHVEPGGATLIDRIRRTSYLRGAHSWRVGETIAWGAGRRRTPAAIVASLMGSAPHRAIILTASFRDLGIGIASTGGGAYTTAVFGRRG